MFRFQLNRSLLHYRGMFPPRVRRELSELVSDSSAEPKATSSNSSSPPPKSTLTHSELIESPTLEGVQNNEYTSSTPEKERPDSSRDARKNANDDPSNEDDSKLKWNHLLMTGLVSLLLKDMYDETKGAISWYFLKEAEIVRQELKDTISERDSAFRRLEKLTTELTWQQSISHDYQTEARELRTVIERAMAVTALACNALQKRTSSVPFVGYQIPSHISASIASLNEEYEAVKKARNRGNLEEDSTIQPAKH